MFESEFFDELFERLGTVERVEVFALKILDNRELKLHTIAVFRRADHDRYLDKPGDLGCAQSSLSRNEFVFDEYALSRALDLFACDGQRLQDAVLADRLS